MSLARLLAHAADRMAVARATDRPVIGYVGADVPVELLTAAGALPLRLFGAPGADHSLGDRYLGQGLDPAARSVLSRLLLGEFGELAGVVVSRDCEASARLFYALRELRRVEPSIALPPVHLVDVLHLPHRTTTRYVLAKIRQLRATLEAWFGHAVSGHELARAIAAHDRLRELLTAMTRLRRERRLTGTQALAVVAATTALPVGRACELVAALLDETLPEADGKPVFLTGSGHDTGDVYAALEETGLLIVGEDHDWGDLLFRRTVGAPTEPALAERYQHNGPAAPTSSIRHRARHTAKAAAECGAELLVLYARVRDDGPPWDFSAQREETGLPAIVLERQPYGAADLGALVPAGAGR
ncbi:2-hydroxyacyl-CoA dehydratase [Amycolatopsis sp. K13G38]|uniref:2-hydroxyacyl-CoA dehydratase n=1 Tax=Amycolatopsis acididurans TaxID=2724524 RepID=A0ABX1IVK1_9PSEU|nr:2-hydroxyacyl-CoA dehydratase family protein [Amycolatopsis acididurans]NKQ51344.1 2-hydroxyacyl-CoA dehydratase [Amycolatopsis acididurans]